jgi:hypothetical protein
MPAARSDIGDVVATRAYVKAAVAQLVGGSVEDEEGGKVLLSDYVKRLAEKLDDLSSRAVQYVVSEDAETGKETRTLTIEGGFLASGVTVDESKKDVKGRLEDLETSVSAYKALTGSDYIDVSGGKVSLKPKVVTTVASGTSTDFVTEGAVVNYVKSREYSLPAATKDALGGIKVGSGLSVAAGGVLSAVGEANVIEGVYATPDSATPLVVDGKKVKFPYASTASHGVVRVASDGCLKVSDKGVLSSDAQENVIEGVRMPDQQNVVTVSGKTAVVPYATATGCGVVKVDGTTITVDGGGVISSVGAKASVTDVTGPDGTTSFLNKVGDVVGTVAVIPDATGTTKGLMSAGSGLAATSGVVSVNVGDGLKTASGMVSVNVGDGLKVSDGAVSVDVGDGLETVDGKMVVSVGGGLNIVSGDVAINVGDGLKVTSDGAVSVSAGDGLKTASGAISVNVGDGLKTASGAISVNVGDGLKTASGAISVNVGDGLKMTSGTIAVDYDSLDGKVGFSGMAKSDDVKAVQTNVASLSASVTNLAVSVANLATVGASARLRDVEIGADGTVALHDHAVNRVRVGATPKLTLRVPASSESTLSRDFYVLLEFTSAYTGEFEVTAVTSPSSGDEVHVYETSTDALGLAGTAKAGSMFLAYFTEVVSGGTFMVSVREIALVSKFEPKGE